MTDPRTPALLPTGLRDLLPPDAGAEAALAEASARALRGGTATSGFKPPLVEFEDSLLSGAGAGLADQTFRLMDPASHRMLAPAQATSRPQIARIAALPGSPAAPRPLRLSYAGESPAGARRQRGCRPERQFRQGRLRADRHRRRRRLRRRGHPARGRRGARRPRDRGQGLLRRSQRADLGGVARCRGSGSSMPSAGGASCARGAWTARTATAVAEDRAARWRSACSSGCCGATGVRRRRRSMRLRPSRAPRRVRGPGRWRQLTGGSTALLREAAPGARPSPSIPVEWRGFEYHTGTGFSLFAGGVRTELGRRRPLFGGRAPARAPRRPLGCTHLPRYAAARSRARAAGAAPDLLCRYGTRAGATALRSAEEGWITVAGLAPAEDLAAEAARLGCRSPLAGRRRAAARRCGRRRGLSRGQRRGGGAPSGATRARARSSTALSQPGPTSSCASRAGTMPAIRWWWTAS